MATHFLVLSRELSPTRGSYHACWLSGRPRISGVVLSEMVFPLSLMKQLLPGRGRISPR